MPQRWRANEGDQLAVLAIEHRRFELGKVILQQRLNRLGFDAKSPNFELRIETTVEMNSQGDGINMASITRSIQATELRMGEKLFCGRFRSIAVAVCQLAAANAELAFCAMRQQFQCGGI